MKAVAHVAAGKKTIRTMEDYAQRPQRRTTIENMPREPRDHILTTNPLYEIILHVLTKRGRDLNKCELCGGSFNGRPNLHHTKYDGATVDDIRIVCSKCDKQPENKGLE